MRHMMVDIETLSSEPGACILSIGACTFSGGKKQPTNLWAVALDHNQSTGKKSTSTAAWWDEQHHIPKEFSFSGKLSEREACQLFNQYCHDVKAHCIWAGPITFDVPIMRDMYRRNQMTFPFHYRAERDSRTIVKFASGLGLPKDTILKQTEAVLGGTFFKHHPMHDAVFQAVLTQKAMNFLG